ncbi:MAG: G/U mismatch-specific DNA glycosylase, partial [Luteibacter sp.]
MTGGLPDLLARDLDVVFCGINPGLAAAASGHHFEGRANRFWRVMHLAGFTPEELTPPDGGRILGLGIGLTTVVARPTAAASDVSARDFIAAASGFERKIATYAPRFVAFLGKAAYAALSRQRDVAWGRQAATIGDAVVWVLPNP